MDRLRFWRNQRRTNRRNRIQDPLRRRRLDLHTIDNAGFQWRVVFVAGVGFFADGYTLFASNFALPMIGYVYWTKDQRSDHETGIDSVTLCGCIVGQIVLGILADFLGRKKLYGWELVILIASSVAVAMSSSGETVTRVSGGQVVGESVDQLIKGESSMRIAAWLMFTRFIAGVGIGADYPLTAVITSEYAPRVHRARMLAMVFAMQSLGQLFAAVVSIIAIASVPNHFDNPSVAVDSMWRWIYGVGAIFPVIALLLRWTIPESPRFTFDVLQNPKQASKDTGELVSGFFRRRRAPGHNDQAQTNGQANGNENGPNVQQAEAGEVNADAAAELDFPPKRSWDDLIWYLYDCGNWRYLLGTAGTWFLMDFAFFGLGLNNPRIVSTVWHGEPFFKVANPPIWDSNPGTLRPGELPYDNFRNTAIHSLLIVSIGAVSGSLILIWLVNHISRKKLMILGFFVLAMLFFVIGGVFSSHSYSLGSQIMVAVFYGFCQFFFDLGPNGLTFMFPAEVFPTRYRCSLYGISAAMGKLGSVIVQGALSHVQFGHRINKQKEPQSLGHVLLAFGAVMLLGALTAYKFLPEVQRSDNRESIALEELADGRRPREESNGAMEMRRGVAAFARRHARPNV